MFEFKVVPLWRQGPSPDRMDKVIVLYEISMCKNRPECAEILSRANLYQVPLSAVA
jgi:hypothetical protein